MDKPLKKKILIIGGVAGGASAAARLRRLDENAEITMIDKGGYISYANCGLPYFVGGVIKEKSALTLNTPEGFKARFNVDVRIFSEATGIDVQAKTADIKDLKTGKIYKESFDNLILSPGAEAIRPDIEGLTGDRTFYLRTASDAVKIREFTEAKKPRTAVILGGGFIGLETAENLSRLGITVTIVESGTQILSTSDYEMAAEVQRHLKENGVTIKLNCAAISVKSCADSLKIKLSCGEEIDADMLILSVGVKPDTGFLKTSGISLNSRGAIETDGHMRTSHPDIYAVGDAAGITDFTTAEKTFIPLAGPANKQGRIAADNICGIKSVYKGAQGSAVVKVFGMTAAFTGINEKTAKRLMLCYDKIYTYSPSHANYYPGAENMCIKVIFEKDGGKILGAQIIGFEGVDKRADILAAVIRMNGKASDLTELELCYAPPFSSAKDPVNMAGYVIENVLSGKSKQFHWHDVESLQKDKNIILLDVRTEKEFNNGHIPGFVNIPLDFLRERLEELDKNKKIYVTCFSGLRGYIACRILTQYGCDCFNLSGGYRQYDILFGK